MQTLKEEVREKIMRAGSVLFKTKGFENTSMKDIEQRAWRRRSREKRQ